jgi:hypothetical protein
MMPIIFFGKNEKHRIILNLRFRKMIKYEKLIPYVTEKLLDFNSNPKGTLTLVKIK